MSHGSERTAIRSGSWRSGVGPIAKANNSVLPLWLVAFGIALVRERAQA